MKKEWKKPVMTVVVKSMAEENVLAGCKGDTPSTGGPGYKCYTDFSGTSPCSVISTT